MKNVGVLFFIFLFIYATSDGQTQPDYIQPRDGIYFYKGEKVRNKHLGRIIQNDKEAFDIYKDYKRLVKKGNRRSLLGGLIATGSILAIAANSNKYGCEEGSCEPILLIGISGTITGIVLIWTGPLLSNKKKKNYLKSAVRTYNENLRGNSEIGYAPSIYLDFGLSDSGIGFIFRF